MTERRRLSAVERMREDSRRTIEQFDAAAALTMQLRNWEQELLQAEDAMKRHEVLTAFSFVAGAFRKAVSERYQSSRSICVRLYPAALTACNETGREGALVTNVLDTLQQKLSNWLRGANGEGDPPDMKMDRVTREVWFLIDLMRLGLKLGDLLTAWKQRQLLRRHLRQANTRGARLDVEDIDSQINDLASKLKKDAAEFTPRLEVLIKPALYISSSSLIMKGLRNLLFCSESTANNGIGGRFVSQQHYHRKEMGLALLAVGATGLLLAKHEIIEKTLARRWARMKPE